MKPKNGEVKEEKEEEEEEEEEKKGSETNNVLVNSIFNRLNVCAVCMSRIVFFGETCTADTRDVLVMRPIIVKMIIIIIIIIFLKLIRRIQIRLSIKMLMEVSQLFGHTWLVELFNIPLNK